MAQKLPSVNALLRKMSPKSTQNVPTTPPLKLQGTIKAYQLDIEGVLIPFLQQRGKSEVAEVTKEDT